MVYDIVFVCNSINNKNIRGNELKILRKVEDQLYFEFGDIENNVKKRFYKDLDTLNNDFEKVCKIKEKLEKEVEAPEEIEETLEEVIEKTLKEIAMANENKTETFNKTKHKSGRKKIF